MLILASGSPRRKLLLKKVFSDYEIVVPDVDESSIDLPAEELPAAESLLKARYVQSLYPDADIIACDTIVCIDGKVLGKPRDEEDAIRMLKEESGRKQTVYSGYTYIHDGKVLTRTVASYVYFNELSEEKITDYVREKKPLDKAGAYGIQDGYGLIDHIEGSFDNVMGLPTEDMIEYCL